MTSIPQERYGASVRLNTLWTAIQARLDTADTRAILASTKGSGVYRDTEDYGAPEGPLNRPWGRQVIVATQTMWPAREMDSSYRGAGWLVRSEMHNFLAPGYDVQVPLERLQQIAYERLVGWTPAPGNGLLVRLRIWRERPPQGMASLDEDRNLWWLSSEFRCEATRI